jgi:hypothetical protein
MLCLTCFKNEAIKNLNYRCRDCFVDAPDEEEERRAILEGLAYKNTGDNFQAEPAGDGIKCREMTTHINMMLWREGRYLEVLHSVPFSHRKRIRNFYDRKVKEYEAKKLREKRAKNRSARRRKNKRKADK